MPVTRRVTRSAARRQESANALNAKDSNDNKEEKAGGEKSTSDTVENKEKESSAKDTPKEKEKEKPAANSATAGGGASGSGGGPPPLEKPLASESRRKAADSGEGEDTTALDDDMADFAAELDALVGGDDDDDLLNLDMEDDEDEFNDRSIPIKYLNEAKVDDLAKIPKVSKSDAEAIVAYRDEKGEFAAWEDLMEVNLPLEEDTQTRLRVSKLKSKKRLTKQARATLKRLETKLRKAAKGVKVSRELLDGIRDGLDILFSPI